MAIPPAAPNQYFTPTFDKDMPQSTATHFRQLYLASSQHDQAIKLIHQQVTAPTTTTVTTTSSAPSDTRVIPGNTPPIASEFITAYDSTSGAFTQAQPVEADVVNLVTDLAAKAPIASPTFTGTVTQPTPPVLTAATTTTSATAGAATALPANPLGYLSISVNGVVVKIPYYSV